MIRMVRSIRAAVCVALLVTAAASCSKSVRTGDASQSGSGDGTTVPNFGGTAPTVPPTTTRALTNAELKSLLPTAAEIGTGYVAVPEGSDDDSSSDFEDAMKDACPELAKVSSEMSNMFTVAYRTEPTSVGRSFVDGAYRTVDVSIDGGGQFIPDLDTLDKLVTAYNECDTITVPDPAIGGQQDIQIQASPDDHYGDLGMVLSLKIDVHGGKLAGSVELQGHVRMFQKDDVGVSITTADGIDPSTGLIIAVDYDLAARLAQRIQTDIARLKRH